MADSNALRSRRHRQHRQGDHSLCLHGGRVETGTGWPPDNAEKLRGIARRRWERESRRRQAPGCRTGDHAACELDTWHGTCSGCGKMIRISRSSAPPELRRCRDCQRANPRRSPRRGSERAGDPRACDLCGESYVPMRHGRPDQRWCSKSCAQAWRNGARPPYSKRIVTGMARKTELSRIRSQRHQETWDGVTDGQIFERDRWRCGICGQRIGKSVQLPPSAIQEH